VIEEILYREVVNLEPVEIKAAYTDLTSLHVERASVTVVEVTE
jgi:hypothetical protein